jgi:hypothetical protein
MDLVLVGIEHGAAFATRNGFWLAPQVAPHGIAGDPQFSRNGADGLSLS